MKPWLPILVLFLSLWSLPTFSQDAHWSLFEYAPLNTNPALTGAFYGTYRLSGIVRDQEFFGNPTQGVSNAFGPTMSFSVDGPIIRGFRKQDWVGVGGMFYQDEAGDGGLTTNFSLFSVAYHLGLDKKQKSVLTFGLQGGSTSRRIKNWDELNFEDGPALGSQSIDATMEMFQFGNVEINQKKNGRRELKQRNGSIDVNFGMLLRTKPNKTTNFEVGIVAKHLFPNRHGFKRAGNINPGDTSGMAAKLPIVVGLHSGMDYQFNKKWSIRPAVQFQTISGGGLYFQLGGMLGYKFDPKKDLILKFGPGFRVGDAAQIFLGLEKGPFRAAMSYDINLSNIAQFTRWGGGAEIAVSYIGTIFKQPDLTPVIICPRY